MRFTDKYMIEAEKSFPENKDKKIIGDDAFAIGEVIEQLINKIEHVRSSLMR